MGRAAEMANSLAIAVAATAVGCTLVLKLAPSHHLDSPSIGPPPPTPASAALTDVTATVQGDSAARAATTALAATAARAPGPRPPAPLRQAGWIRVTAPTGPISLRAHGSFPVDWTNTTGTDVDVWLSSAAGRGRAQRLARVSPRAGSAAAGEAIVTLPRVRPGPAYSLEVVSGNGAVHAFSKPFAVTE
ncbi:hypothetical protein GCM10010211_13190 [Streptomyces albospinus]|uniref:Uncharacterized protein n=1 Tax=Streptomyces albospinus TaxID=285515 RepID=A0ABQ2UTB3_9ACTN|nr:hypothetical protein [Streptomyces albospinus]GGU50268.1 hypothetical protein GCM10010211_13190 [Streptomyces albospinus]